MAEHRIPATPETIRWGAFDASFKPVLEVNSGDLVVLECVSGAPDAMPDPATGLKVPPALAAIHASNPPRLGPHILTGPVAVRGAMPGDVLRVDIEKIELGCDWGFCGFRPLGGTCRRISPTSACCTSRWTARSVPAMCRSAPGSPCRCRPSSA